MTPKVITATFAAFFVLAGATMAQPADGGGSEGHHHGALRQACQADVARLCGDASQGHGQVRQCLMSHNDQLSDACKSAIAQAQQWRQHHDADGGPAAN